MQTIHESFIASVEAEPGKVLFERPGLSDITYAQARDLTERFAAVLTEIGVRPGDRVAVQTEKSAEAICLYLAVLQVGGVYLPLNTAYTGAEIDYFLGDAAPRLNDVDLLPEDAREFHAFMIGEIVKMLCAGLVHGDLSEFNVLLDPHGPVIIDLPQAVDAAANSNAKRMLGRDVDNLADYFGQFAPQLLTTRYGEEIWALYEAGSLHPDSVLTGRFEDPTDDVNLDEVIQVIEAADAEHAERLARQQAAEAVDDWTPDT